MASTIISAAPNSQKTGNTPKSTTMTITTSNMTSQINKIYKAFENNQSIFTDYFNVYQLTNVPNFLKQVNYITFNSVDSIIFSKWFNIDNVQSIKSNALNVLVNPPTIQNGVACLFTLPRPDTDVTLLFYDLKTLTIDDSKEVVALSAQNLQYTNANCPDFSCISFGFSPIIPNLSGGKNINTNITPDMRFSLILQMLVQYNMSITTSLYQFIQNSLSNYVLYRKIIIQDDGLIVNPYIRDRLVTCKYSRSGIPL